MKTAAIVLTAAPFACIGLFHFFDQNTGFTLACLVMGFGAGRALVDAFGGDS